MFQLSLFAVISSLIASTAMAGGPIWQQIAACDQGRAVLDRHFYNPRLVQLVIRDRAIVSYLRKNRIEPSNAYQEVILTGENDVAIYRSDDFHGFTDMNSAGRANGKLDWTRREGKGIRVSFNRWISPDSSSGSGTMAEVANWYFRDCE